MAGNRAGGLKAKQKNLAKNPNHYRDIGKKGGQAQVPKGFAKMSRKRLLEISSKGGLNPGKARRKDGRE